MAKLIFCLSLLILVSFFAFAEEEVKKGFPDSIEETMYRKIMFSADCKESRDFFLNACREAGFSSGTAVFREIRNIPILYFHACGEESFSYGQEFFFSPEGQLCSHGVHFFPQKNTILLKDISGDCIMDSNWKVIHSKDEALFYRKDFEFSEYHIASGRVLKGKDAFGRYVDDLNRPVYPSFVYIEGKWKHVLPLREKFRLDVEKDRFMMQIVSEQQLSLKKEEFLEITALRAGEVSFDTTRPYLWVLSGRELQGVTIPRLTIVDDKDIDIAGTYIYELNYHSSLPEENGHEKMDNAEISWKISPESVLLEVRVLSESINNEEIEKIAEIVNDKLPVFYRSNNSRDFEK